MQSEHGQDIAFKKSILNYYNFKRSKQLICTELTYETQANSEYKQNKIRKYFGLSVRFLVPSKILKF